MWSFSLSWKAVTAEKEIGNNPASLKFAALNSFPAINFNICPYTDKIKITIIGLLLLRAATCQRKRQKP